MSGRARRDDEVSPEYLAHGELVPRGSLTLRDWRYTPSKAECPIQGCRTSVSCGGDVVALDA
jgi:hypothetical protein